jgi:hypothetical protein
VRMEVLRILGWESGPFYNFSVKSLLRNYCAEGSENHSPLVGVEVS